MGPTDVVIKVYFSDGSYKKMVVDENDPTPKVIQTILDKVTFPKTNGLMLFVYTGDTSRDLAENEQPGSLFKKWESEKITCRLVFKRKKDTFKCKDDEIVAAAASSASTSNISATSNSPPTSSPPQPNKEMASKVGPPSRPPPAPISQPPAGPPPQPDQQQPPPRALPMGGNPLMAELSAKRAAQDNKGGLLRSVPKKEQSQQVIIQWINKKFEESSKSERIENLEHDLKDGTVLAVLLESLSGLAIKDFNRSPSTKIQIIENHNIILRFLKVLGVNLVNINGEDMWEARPETMMRIMGIIIKHFIDSDPSATKARYSMIVQNNQQQQPGGAYVRKPPPLVRRPQADGASPAPPPSTNDTSSSSSNVPKPSIPLRKVAPPQQQSSKPSAFVPKPPPTANKPKPMAQNTPPPGQSQLKSSGDSNVVRQPPPTVAKRPPPVAVAKKLAAPPPPSALAKSPPPSVLAKSPPPSIAVSKKMAAPPPPTTGAKKPSLPPRNFAGTLPPPPLPADLPPPPPPITNHEVIDDFNPLSPAKLPPPPAFPSEPIAQDEYDTAETHGNLPPPPPPLPSSLPPSLSISDNEYHSALNHTDVPLPPPSTPPTPPVAHHTPSSALNSSGGMGPIPGRKTSGGKQLPQLPQTAPLQKNPLPSPPPPRRNVNPPPPTVQNTTNFNNNITSPPPPPIISAPPPPPSRTISVPVVEEQYVEEDQYVEETYEEQQYEEETYQQEEEYVQEEQQQYEEESYQEESTPITIDGDMTFEELESIINSNTFSYESLLKEHNLENNIPDDSASNNTLYDMSVSDGSNNKEKDNLGLGDDLDDLLERLTRGEV